MRKRTLRLLTLSLLSALAIGAPLAVRSADMAGNADTPKTQKRDTMPFTGKVKAVDKAALTLTLVGKERDRVFSIGTQTKMTKGGQPATLDDIAVGEEVGGQARMLADGRNEVLTLRIGPKPEDPANPGKAKANTKKK
jgi:hypothetical protein